MRRFILFVLLLSLAAGAIFYYYQQKEQKTRHALLLYGNVDVRQVDLGFRVMGRINQMPWQEGDWIPKGTLMAKLDKQPYADQVQQAMASMQANKAQLSYAEQVLKRRQELQSEGGISQEDYENAQSNYNIYSANVRQSEAAIGIAKTNLQDTELFAPNDGTILTRIREPGSVVREADPIYTLSLVSPVWVRTYVSEPELGLIYPGMPAEVSTDTPNGTIYKGYIGFISPVAEFTPKTVETTQLRTDLVYRLRVIVENPDNGLRQGMPVTVTLPLKQNEDEKSSERNPS